MHTCTKRSRWWLLAAGLVAMAAARLLVAAPARAGVTFPRFDLEAHRGGRDLRPENTLASFRHALSMGVTTLELDIQITRDGVPVIHHDQRLTGETARNAQHQWIPKGQEVAIHKLTLAEVKTYDVGAINPAYQEYFTLHGRTQRTSPGERVPTLDELFRLVEESGDSKVLFNIETKSNATAPDGDMNPPPAEFVRLIMDVVHKHHMEQRVMIQSFDWRTLLEMRRLYPKVTRIALVEEETLGTNPAAPSAWMAGFSLADFGGDYVKAAHGIHANVVSPWFPMLTPALVAQAHRMDMKVVPWTVNKRDDMARLLDLGVDGIITDRPDLLKALLDEKGISYR